MEALEAQALGDAGGAVHVLTVAALATARALAARTSALMLLEAELPLLQSPAQLQLHRASATSSAAPSSARQQGSDASSEASRSSLEEAPAATAGFQWQQHMQVQGQAERAEPARPLPAAAPQLAKYAAPLPSPLLPPRQLPLAMRLSQRLLTAAATTPWAAPFRGFADVQLEAAFQQWAGGLSLSRNQLHIGFQVLFITSNTYKALCVEVWHKATWLKGTHWRRSSFHVR